MEEKERFELFGEHCIKDNNPDARPQLLDAYVACVILNEQDKRIKELEQENQQLKQQLAITEKALELLAQEYICYTDEVEITPIISQVMQEAKEMLGNE